MDAASPTNPVLGDLPKVIPPCELPNRRTMVLCFDGTGDQFDADNSNVIQFFSLLKKDDHNQQMVYYQSGIGTYTVPQSVTPLASKISKTMDMAIAWNLGAHVMDGYSFLMENYQAGDKICIFGFSRGAYTARSLAGMLHKVGLLPAGNHQQVPFAYKMYNRCDDAGWKQSVAFKKAFSINVDIEFVGVWDTVCSVGLIPRHLPFVSSNTAIHYFRHAISLDERRAKFKANLYNRPTEKEAQLGVKPDEMPTPDETGLKDVFTTAKATELLSNLIKLNDPQPKAHDDVKGKQKSAHKRHKSDMDSDSDHEIQEQVWEREYNKHHKRPETDVLEVWFAGCHCDVGGGSVDNEIPHNLARIPLRWMIRQCFLANTGIRFHTKLLPKVGLNPHTLYPIVQQRPPPLYASDLVIPQQGPQIPSLPSSPTKANELTPLVDVPAIHDRTVSGATTKTLVNNGTLRSFDSASPGMLTEEEEDLADALCPIYDQLSIAKGWWVLELLPMKLRYQNPIDNEWEQKMIINLGRGRDVPVPTLPGAKINFHRTVDIRMKARSLVQNLDKSNTPYVPKAKFRSEINWAD